MSDDLQPSVPCGTGGASCLMTWQPSGFIERCCMSDDMATVHTQPYGLLLPDGREALRLRQEVLHA